MEPLEWDVRASTSLHLQLTHSLQFWCVDKEVICLPLATLSSVPSSPLEALTVMSLFYPAVCPCSVKSSGVLLSRLFYKFVIIPLNSASGTPPRSL